MRNCILPFALMALAAAPVMAAQTPPAVEKTEEKKEPREIAPPAAKKPEASNESGAALHSGGPSNTNPSGTSLQQAMRACDGLSGSASARCQERVLADHPGAF